MSCNSDSNRESKDSKNSKYYTWDSKKFNPSDKKLNEYYCSKCNDNSKKDIISFRCDGSVDYNKYKQCWQGVL